MDDVIPRGVVLDGTPERLIQRLEDACADAPLFCCDADYEEAVEIAQEEFDLATSAAEARGRAAGQWQPIETCPSDGRSIIVFGGRFDIPAVTQADGEWWNSTVGQTLGSRPTHWQPLPTPPEPPALDVADRTEGGR
jgi:hypothetical protein